MTTTETEATPEADGGIRSRNDQAAGETGNNDDAPRATTSSAALLQKSEKYPNAGCLSQVTSNIDASVADSQQNKTENAVGFCFNKSYYSKGSWQWVGDYFFWLSADLLRTCSLFS